MAVTKRDLALLNGLGNFRVLTMSQIRRYYFDDLARPLVQRRLSKLRAQKLLRSYPFGGQGALAWTLTSHAARLVERSEKIFRRPPNRNTLAHDLVIADIGLQLQELGILHEWLSTYEIELGLYHTQRHIPDAIFRLKVGDKLFGPIALEVENTLKSRQRINGMLYEYAEWFRVTDLWLFWRKDWMAKAFRKAAKNQEAPRVWIGKDSLNIENLLLLEDLQHNILDLKKMSKSVNAAERSDTPSDTHAINSMEAKSVLCDVQKSPAFKTLGTPSTPASAFPDIPDPSLSTIDRGQEW